MSLDGCLYVCRQLVSIYVYVCILCVCPSAPGTLCTSRHSCQYGLLRCSPDDKYQFRNVIRMRRCGSEKTSFSPLPLQSSSSHLFHLRAFHNFRLVLLLWYSQFFPRIRNKVMKRRVFNRKRFYCDLIYV